MLFVNDFSWMKYLILSWLYDLGSGTKCGSSWSWRACISDSCYQRNGWVLFPATCLKFWDVILFVSQERYKMVLCDRVTCKLCKSIKCETPSEDSTPQSTVFCSVHALQFLHWSLYGLDVHVLHTCMFFFYFFILTIIWWSPVAAVNTSIWWHTNPLFTMLIKNRWICYISLTFHWMY